MQKRVGGSWECLRNCVPIDHFPVLFLEHFQPFFYIPFCFVSFFMIPFNSFVEFLFTDATTTTIIVM